jgi:hypothetical protein
VDSETGTVCFPMQSNRRKKNEKKKNTFMALHTELKEQKMFWAIVFMRITRL